MKPFRSKYFLHAILGAALCAGLASCTGEEKEKTTDTTEHGTTTEAPRQAPARPEGESVYLSYLDIKNALAGDNPQDAQAAAKKLFVNLDSLKESSLPAAEGWKKTREKIKFNASKIAASSDIKEQRQAFEGLSDAIQTAIIDNGLPVEGTVYKQYCPMAFQDKGAYWLSESDKVQNPYFGDEMYECGTVEGVVKPKEKK